MSLRRKTANDVKTHGQHHLTKGKYNAGHADEVNGSNIGKHVISGTKYNRYGSRGAGLASMMDNELISDNIQQKEKNWGGGAYSFVALDRDGNPAKNAVLNFNNRAFSRPDGRASS